jgi:hypothetical protein
MKGRVKGETLVIDKTLLTADYECNLSSDEGDVFIIEWYYSVMAIAYVWRITAFGSLGTLTDGGDS